MSRSTGDFGATVCHLGEAAASAGGLGQQAQPGHEHARDRPISVLGRTRMTTPTPYAPLGMRVLPTPSQSRAKPQNGCSPASDTLRMEHDSSIPGRVGAAGLVQCPLGCSCPPGPGRPRSTDGLPRVLRAVGRRCPAGRSHRLQLDCRDVGDGWAAPDDRSILHEDANRCFTEQPVLFGHPASNPHPGRASSNTATYSCPVALCADPLSHADGGAVGRNTAWHASALADLALRQAPTPRSGDRPVATHPMGWGSTPSCMQQRRAMSRSPQR